MTQLINKGGFRERANRSRHYKQSENSIATLIPSQYQPSSKSIDPLTSPQQQTDNEPKQQQP